MLDNAPTALETYQVVGAINGRTSLSPAEREVIQITAASRNGCGFCVAGHTKLSLKALKLDEKLVADLREIKALDDPKLNALARFTLALIEQRGQVSDEQLKEFLDAGYGEQQVLEAVLGVSLASLCNYANNVAQTLINKELQEFA